ncbi:chaperone NapD [Belnapia rosea]|uniref:chaperone NapD n=1 Tax=Belnapia rosea TaxID=938405 RepID=UPI000881E55D|nr:chaperone NapD [Belnapia rosea]SDB74730.1 periplasmic nitrate reductase chaperone NapD [Belnapia rosea]
MPEEFHISSLVVHCRRENADQVATTLRAMNGMEVHGGVPEGKLVVTLETATEGEIVECLNQVQLLEGVLAATLVFHQFELTNSSEASTGRLQI